MATLSAPALIDIYQALEASPQYPSMRRGGIVGDLRHQRRGGYHISRQDQTSASNYSIQAPADKRGPSNLASGIDLTMNPADMRRMTQRLMDACKRNRANPATEPRIECVREFFGTLNGRTVTGWNRYPSSNRGVGLTSSDSSHLWHVHISIFRAYANDPQTIKGLINILLGVPLTPAPPPPPTDPEDKEFAVATVAEVLFSQVIDNPDPDAPKDNQKVSLVDLLSGISRDVDRLRAEVAASRSAADRGERAPEDQVPPASVSE